MWIYASCSCSGIPQTCRISHMYRVLLSTYINVFLLWLSNGKLAVDTHTHTRAQRIIILILRD